MDTPDAEQRRFKYMRACLDFRNRMAFDDDSYDYVRPLARIKPYCSATPCYPPKQYMYLPHPALLCETYYILRLQHEASAKEREPAWGPFRPGTSEVRYCVCRSRNHRNSPVRERGHGGS